MTLFNKLFIEKITFYMSFSTIQYEENEFFNYKEEIIQKFIHDY